MRVVLYTHPFFLEPALQFARAMARRTELHFFLELTPRSTGTLLPSTPPGLAHGVIDARPILEPLLPKAAMAYLDDAASVRVANFPNPRTFDPRTIPASLAVIRAVEGLKPDILHLDDGSLRLALAGPRLPSIDVLDVHDPVPHSGDANRRLALGRRLVLAKVRRHRVHAACFRAPYAARVGVPIDRVDVGLLGVYDIFRAWASHPVERDARTILFIGRIAPYKGLDVLYRAAPMIAAHVPDLRVIVAGRPTGAEPLPTPPALPNGGRVEIIAGHLANEQVADLHRRATVVACPYRDATQSGVVLTAYAFETPVVASAVGGLPEYVEDGVSGVLVPPGQPAALAAALLEVLGDAPLRARLGEGARALGTGRLDWETIADGAMETYRAAGGPRSHASSSEASSSR